MMDFANIQNIVIPEGEVDVIARGSEILWQKVKYKRELLYLESTGTQWIDIDTTINTATDEVEFVFQNTEPNVYKWFFGEHDNNARFGLGSGDGANKRNVAYGNNTYKVSDAAMYNTIHTFEANQNGVFIDGSKVANFASFASTSTLYLFNLNLSGGNYACSAKVWSYKHSRNGVLIRDLIPAIDANDIPCMYDKVSGKLFYNQGSGQFGYAELSRLPLEYQEVEYLESTGTQYIDTGINPDDTYGYFVDMEQIESWSEQCPIGCMDAGNRFVGVYFANRTTGTTTTSLSVGFGSYVKTEVYPAGFNVNQKVITSCNYMSNRKVIFDGYEIKDLSDINIKGAISRTIYLFNRHYSSSAIFKGRIYNAVISKDNEIVADFVPCYRKADGEAGMYDLVTETFFTNQGTGTFGKGADV